MKKIWTIVLTFSLFFIVLAVPAKMELASLMFYTSEEYEKFIEETDLPNNFVYYDSVSIFGEFEYLNFHGMFQVCGYDPELMQYGGYEYAFVAEKKDPSSYRGGHSIFWVQPEYDENDKNHILGTPKKFEFSESNLSSGYADGYYDLNGVVYRYRESRLYSIGWERDGILYAILPDYENNNVFAPDSFIGKLLDKNTAPEAIEFLKNYNFTGKPTEPTPPETADFSPIFPILSVISAGGFTIFAVKKKKQL